MFFCDKYKKKYVQVLTDLLPIWTILEIFLGKALRNIMIMKIPN